MNLLDGGRALRILAPLANEETVPALVAAADQLATALGADLVLLHVAVVPFGDAERETPERRAHADRLFDLARGALAPGRRVERVARFASHAGSAIRQALRDLDIDLMLVGWRDAPSLDRLARGTLRPILQNPVCDVAMLRLGGASPAFSIASIDASVTPLALRVAASYARTHDAPLAVYDALGPRARPRVLPFARRSMIHRLLQERTPGLTHDVFLDESERPLPETLARVAPFDLAVLPATWDPNLRGLAPLGLAAADQGSVLLLSLRTTRSRSEPR